MTAKVLCEGEEIGYFGMVSYEVQKKAECEKPAFVGKIDYEKLSQHFKGLIRYTPIPQFPIVSRDLALVADESTTCGEICDVIRAACKQVTAVELFDVYRSEQVGAGKKSMAFGITFTPTDAPLTPQQIDKFVDKILKSLQFRLKVTVR
jgi:phenylalanyl-tRNA synthetase beta chain